MTTTYPATKQSARSDRAPVESELASFYAGTQFRTFKEITLASVASLVVKMVRPVDLMHVKTAGASGQSSTVGDEMSDTLGIPKDSVGIYKFTNPGNASATCIFTMWWEEVVP